MLGEEETVKEQLHRTKEFLAEKLEEAKERVEEVGHQLKERVIGFKDQGLQDLVAATRSYVRDNPGKAILGSLIVGFIAGLMVRRR